MQRSGQFRGSQCTGIGRLFGWNTADAPGVLRKLRHHPRIAHCRAHGSTHVYPPEASASFSNARREVRIVVSRDANQCEAVLRS
jgi:hypothetical protein